MRRAGCPRCPGGGAAPPGHRPGRVPGRAGPGRAVPGSTGRSSSRSAMAFARWWYAMVSAGRAPGPPGWAAGRGAGALRGRGGREGGMDGEAGKERGLWRAWRRDSAFLKKKKTKSPSSSGQVEARRAPFVPSHPTRCQQTGQKTGGVGGALSSFSHPPSNSGSRDDETSPGRVRRDFMWDCSCFGKSCAAPFSQERVLDCRWVVAVLLPGRAAACQTLPGQTTALRRLPVVWMDLVRGSLR